MSYSYCTVEASKFGTISTPFAVFQVCNFGTRFKFVIVPYGIIDVGPTTDVIVLHPN